MSAPPQFPVFARLAAWRTAPVPFVPQLSATECGAACLAMTLAAFGRDVGLDGVRAASDAGRDGMTANELLNVARRFALEGRGVRLEMDELRYLRRGAILHWISGHFVVFERIEPKGRIVIVDPAQGRCSLSSAEFSRQFSGVALLLEPGTGFRKEGRDRPLLSRRSVWLTRETKSLARLLVLSMMLQVLGLALPIITGTILDRTIPSADVDMLLLLAVGGALAVMMFFIASVLRGALLVALRARLDASITSEFLGRLTRAPLTFLLQRGTGDLLQRMSSIASVRDLAAEGLMSAALDGVLVVTYLAVLLASSPATALAVAALGLLEFVLFLATRGTQRRLLGEALATESRTSGFQVELLAGLTTLKAMGLESLAVTRWTNLFVDNLNSSMRRGTFDSAVEALRSALRMLGPLLLLLLGAREVMSGRLSIGGMLAANALALGFLGPLAGLFSAASRFDRILGHLERIDDVLSAPPEQEKDPTRPLPAAGARSGTIRLENVSYKYPGRASFGVGDITLEAGAGSRVALVGPSGAGKSTIANLILGLFVPSEGRVLHDDRDLQGLDLESVRRKIGVVPQVPFFFSGTIRENITLGDSDVSMETVIEAARRAQLHDEIMAMPMGYQTLLLDRGGSLSGGQRQRLALARALCRRPTVLLLDEATSALDSLTEQRLRESISALKCTRVVIAHRFATIVDFDMIVFVDQGKIVERGTHGELLALGGRYAQMFHAQNLLNVTPNDAVKPHGATSPHSS